MDPVNKLYRFDWMILISARICCIYMCVCFISVIVDFSVFFVVDSFVIKIFQLKKTIINTSITSCTMSNISTVTDPVTT